MPSLDSELDAIAAETEFSGVVRIDRGDEIVVAKAYGLAHRGYGIPNEVDTRFGTASATKTLTALTVVGLIERGRLELSSTARSVLGADLPLIHEDVTVEHLLAHRSGIGDYLDENDPEIEVEGYVMPVPVHQLAATEDYLAVLGGHLQKFDPGERFSYCNGGYVVLALIAERTSGISYHDLVAQRVCEPAGMVDTAFLRSDELPGRTALGYLQVDGVWRSNVLHLPVRGTGDGGIYTTVADVHSFWTALYDGRIVPLEWVAEMVRPRSVVPENEGRYGLGFWLGEADDTVALEGMDAGVSFRSVHDPGADVTYTVISNTTDGAWPLTRFLRGRFAPGAAAG